MPRPAPSAPAIAELFDAMAPTYEDLEPWYEHLYTRLHALLDSVLRPAPGTCPGRALDAGCGTGLQARQLQALGYRVHGLDLSHALLVAARRRAPALCLVRGRVEALPYPADTFDAAVCCGSTLSFVSDPGRALGELGRVLRPGGWLLLECEHVWNLDLLWALLDALSGGRLGYGLGPAELWRALWGGHGRWLRYPGYGPLRLFTTAELRRLLAAAGLTVRRRWGIHTLTNLLPSTVLHRPRLGRFTGLLFRGLAAADDLLRPWPGLATLANSLVLLAERAHEGSRSKPGEGASLRAAGISSAAGARGSDHGRACRARSGYHQPRRATGR